MSQIRPQDTVERALALAKPGGECVVIAHETSTANLRWAGNTLTTNGVAASRSLTVIAIDLRDGDTAGVGVVSRSGVGQDQVEDVVREAEKAAEQASPAEDATQLLPGDAQVRSEWEEGPVATDFGVFRGFAEQLGETLRAAEGAGRKLYGFAEHGMTSTFLGTSAGVRLRYDQPEGRLELNGKSADMTGSAWAGASTRDFRDVDVASMDAGLAERLSWQSRRVELPAGRYETLLPPTAVSDLMAYMYWSAAGARDTGEGRTVFSKPGGGTRIGERLSELPVDLFSDPAYPGLECSPFVVVPASGRDFSVFDNGMPARRTPWISGGVLSALHSSRYSASQAGVPVTPYVDNLIMTSAAPDSPSLASMISSTSRALLVTCVWYVREVDPQTLLLTGLTRDGVYLVENGEVTGAVNNFRFNESPVGMLSRLVEVGATERTLPREFGDYFNRAAMPPLRVEAFNMSSVSQGT
jgi:predicted Zn-dependent protease